MASLGRDELKISAKYPINRKYFRIFFKFELVFGSNSREKDKVIRQKNIGIQFN